MIFMYFIILLCISFKLNYFTNQTVSICSGNKHEHEIFKLTHMFISDEHKISLDRTSEIEFLCVGNLN